MKPLYIAFEGIEGSGKSTLAKLLSKKLETLGISHILTAEPGSTFLGKRLREIILEIEMDPLTELFLYLADRREHIKNVVKPALSNGKWVISDRCFLSSIAYQGHGRGLGADFVEDLCLKTTESLFPDVIFLLDLNPEKALKRLPKKDRIEREPLNFHQKVREGYLLEASKRKNIVILNAEENPEKMLQEILKTLNL